MAEETKATTRLKSCLTLAFYRRRAFEQGVIGIGVCRPPASAATTRRPPSNGFIEKTEKEAQVEVNFYATAKPDGELVWTGTTNTFEASSAMKAIKALVKIVAKELERENIIEPESK